jgi:hypothetical protein
MIKPKQTETMRYISIPAPNFRILKTVPILENFRLAPQPYKQQRNCIQELMDVLYVAQHVIRDKQNQNLDTAKQKWLGGNQAKR